MSNSFRIRLIILLAKELGKLYALLPVMETVRITCHEMNILHQSRRSREPEVWKAKEIWKKNYWGIYRAIWIQTWRAIWNWNTSLDLGKTRICTGMTKAKGLRNKIRERIDNSRLTKHIFIADYRGRSGNRWFHGCGRVGRNEIILVDRTIGQPPIRNRRIPFLSHR